MDEKKLQDFLERIIKEAENNNTVGIFAMCENEIEEIQKRTLKQDVVDAVRLVEDAKYEVTRLRHDDTDDLYKLLDCASKILRNLANKKELNKTTGNENV